MKQTRLDDERRRALAVLAGNPDGCTRTSMLARGFSLALLNRLFRSGLATIEREERGDDMVEIVLKTTEAGRQALEKGGLPETTLSTDCRLSGDTISWAVVPVAAAVVPAAAAVVATAVVNKQHSWYSILTWSAAPRLGMTAAPVYGAKCQGRVGGGRVRSAFSGNCGLERLAVQEVSSILAMRSCINVSGL